MRTLDVGYGQRRRLQGYRCWHRGKGCDVPRFRNTGLLQGALLGVRLIREDDEDLRLNTRLEALQGQREPEPSTESEDAFERVLTVLTDLDWDAIWDAATDNDRRTLLDEFLVRLDVFPDDLEVEIRGAGPLLA